MSRLEGNGAARMLQLMRRYGHNTDVDVEIGKVVALLPSIKIQLNSVNLMLEDNDMIIADHLLSHKRTVSISGGAVVGNVNPSGNLTSFALTDATMSINSPLKVGDEVILLSANDGQLYYVMDKVG